MRGSAAPPSLERSTSREQQLLALKSTYERDALNFETKLGVLQSLDDQSASYLKLKAWLDSNNRFFNGDVFINPRYCINDIEDRLNGFQQKRAKYSQNILEYITQYRQQVANRKFNHPRNYLTYRNYVLFQLAEFPEFNLPGFESIQKKIHCLDDENKNDNEKINQLVSEIQVQKIALDKELQKEKRSSFFGGFWPASFSKGRLSGMYGELLKNSGYFSLSQREFVQNHERYLDYLKLLENFRSVENEFEGSGELKDKLKNYHRDLKWLEDRSTGIKDLHLKAMNPKEQESFSEASMQKTVKAFYVERARRFQPYFNAVHAYKRKHKKDAYCHGKLSFDAYCNVVLHTLATYNRNNLMRIASINLVKLEIIKLKKDQSQDDDQEKIKKLRKFIAQQKIEVFENHLENSPWPFLNEFFKKCVMPSGLVSRYKQLIKIADDFEAKLSQNRGHLNLK